MNRKSCGQILIECPNTIFHLYVNNETELTKIEIFMRNIRSVKKLSLNDIYGWCNHQGIAYNTSFNYHKDFSISKNLKSYFQYSTQKIKYQYQIQFGFGMA